MSATPTPTATQTPLRRSLGRVDMVLLTVAATVGIDTIAQIAAAGGAEAFTWAVVVAATFVVPYGLLMAEVGSGFRQQGGPFVWVRLVFGRFVAGLTALFYWVTNPIWLGGSLAVIVVATWDRYVHPLAPGGLGDVTLKLGFVWVAIATAVIGLRYGKVVVNIGALVKLALLVLLAGTVVVYAVRDGVHGYLSGALSPTVGGFLAVTPVMLFAVVGLEAQNGAAEEMRRPRRDVPTSVAVSAVVSMAAYLVPVLGILAVVPPDRIDGASGFLDAVATVFAVYGPAGPPLLTVAAVAFMIAVLTQGSAWMIASDRVQAVAAAEGAFPRWFGVIDRRLGTPVRVNLLSGVVASAFTLVATLLSDQTSSSLFAVVLSVAISTLLMSYLVMIPAAVALRWRFPAVERPFRVPGGPTGVLLCGTVVTLWVVLGSVSAVFPGVIESWLGIPYDFAGEWGVDRGTFEALSLGTLGVLLAVGVIGFLVTRDRTEVTAG